MNVRYLDLPDDIRERLIKDISMEICKSKEMMQLYSKHSSHQIVIDHVLCRARLQRLRGALAFLTSDYYLYRLIEDEIAQ